jgi:hypothetical protein
MIAVILRESAVADEPKDLQLTHTVNVIAASVVSPKFLSKK